jgi:hypothetical protein
VLVEKNLEEESRKKSSMSRSFHKYPMMKNFLSDPDDIVFDEETGRYREMFKGLSLPLFDMDRFSNDPKVYCEKKNARAIMKGHLHFSTSKSFRKNVNKARRKNDNQLLRKMIAFIEDEDKDDFVDTFNNPLPYSD